MKTVNIELTEEQARLLSFVMASCGGNYEYSGRKITDEIQEKLFDLNMSYTQEIRDKFPMREGHSSIQFKQNYSN